jgi:hypothetical protein
MTSPGTAAAPAAEPRTAASPPTGAGGQAAAAVRAAAAPGAADPPGSGGGGRPDRQPWWRRYRVPLFGAVGVLLVILIVGLAHARSLHGELDPRAADPGGSRALATLLGERGVPVVRVTRLDDALAGLTEGSIVFIPFPELVPAAGLRRVGDLASGQVVLVGPDPGRLAALTEQVTLAATDVAVATRLPECSVPGAVAAGSADLGGQAYRADTAGGSCYPVDGDATLAVSETRGGARLTVLGSGSFLGNGRLGQAGNAALGLNLLGADGSADEVRWLVPSPGSAAADDQTGLSDIVPGWVGPATLQLLLAALVAALWRARRLGPPVVEPLPVVVRSAEAMEGRARLYRRAQARDRAADALRLGARSRLTPRLGLGRDRTTGGEPAPAAVVEVIADWTGRPEAELRTALYGPPPADDAALVRLADALDSIVRDTLDPEVRRP